MKRAIFLLAAACAVPATAQNWHVNIEPVYYLAKAPNIALDYHVGPSLSLGLQYSAIDWGKGGNNLSGIQAFYSRTGKITQDTEVLKLYVGLLSANTTLLGIETKNDPVPLYEVLYGYRWVFSGNLTVAVLGGVWFTSEKLYPGLSIPVGYMF